MREADLEAFFRKQVKLAGGRSIKLLPVEKGIPDRLVFFPGGRIFLVELKADDGVLSPAQVLWHRKLRTLGTPVHVLVGKPRVVAWVRSHALE